MGTGSNPAAAVLVLIAFFATAIILPMIASKLKEAPMEQHEKSKTIKSKTRTVRHCCARLVKPVAIVLKTLSAICASIVATLVYPLLTH